MGWQTGPEQGLSVQSRLIPGLLQILTAWLGNEAVVSEESEIMLVSWESV